MALFAQKDYPLSLASRMEEGCCQDPGIETKGDTSDEVPPPNIHEMCHNPLIWLRAKIVWVCLGNPRMFLFVISVSKGLWVLCV